MDTIAPLSFDTFDLGELGSDIKNIGETIAEPFANVFTDEGVRGVVGAAITTGGAVAGITAVFGKDNTILKDGGFGGGADTVVLGGLTAIAVGGTAFGVSGLLLGAGKTISFVGQGIEAVNDQIEHGIEKHVIQK